MNPIDYAVSLAKDAESSLIPVDMDQDHGIERPYLNPVAVLDDGIPKTPKKHKGLAGSEVDAVLTKQSAPVNPRAARASQTPRFDQGDIGPTDYPTPRPPLEPARMSDLYDTGIPGYSMVPRGSQPPRRVASSDLSQLHIGGTLPELTTSAVNWARGLVPGRQTAPVTPAPASQPTTPLATPATSANPAVPARPAAPVTPTRSAQNPPKPVKPQPASPATPVRPAAPVSPAQPSNTAMDPAALAAVMRAQRGQEAAEARLNRLQQWYDDDWSRILAQQTAGNEPAPLEAIMPERGSRVGLHAVGPSNIPRSPQEKHRAYQQQTGRYHEPFLPGGHLPASDTAAQRAAADEAWQEQFRAGRAESKAKMDEFVRTHGRRPRTTPEILQDLTLGAPTPGGRPMDQAKRQRLQDTMDMRRDAALAARRARYDRANVPQSVRQMAVALDRDLPSGQAFQDYRTQQAPGAMAALAALPATGYTVPPDLPFEEPVSPEPEPSRPPFSAAEFERSLDPLAGLPNYGTPGPAFAAEDPGQIPPIPPPETLRTPPSLGSHQEPNYGESFAAEDPGFVVSPPPAPPQPPPSPVPQRKSKVPANTSGHEWLAGAIDSLFAPRQPATRSIPTRPSAQPLSPSRSSEKSLDRILSEIQEGGLRLRPTPEAEIRHTQPYSPALQTHPQAPEAESIPLPQLAIPYGNAPYWEVPAPGEWYDDTADLREKRFSVNTKNAMNWGYRMATEKSAQSPPKPVKPQPTTSVPEVSTPSEPALVTTPLMRDTARIRATEQPSQTPATSVTPTVPGPPAPVATQAQADAIARAKAQAPASTTPAPATTPGPKPTEPERGWGHAWQALKGGDLAGAWSRTPQLGQLGIGGGGIILLLLLLSKLFGGQNKAGSIDYSDDEIDEAARVLDNLTARQKAALWAEACARRPELEKQAWTLACRYAKERKIRPEPEKSKLRAAKGSKSASTASLPVAPSYSRISRPTASLAAKSPLAAATRSNKGSFPLGNRFQGSMQQKLTKAAQTPPIPDFIRNMSDQELLAMYSQLSEKLKSVVPNFQPQKLPTDDYLYRRRNTQAQNGSTDDYLYRRRRKQLANIKQEKQSANTPLDTAGNYLQDKGEAIRAAWDRIPRAGQLGIGAAGLGGAGAVGALGLHRLLNKIRGVDTEIPDTDLVMRRKRKSLLGRTLAPYAPTGDLSTAELTALHDLLFKRLAKGRSQRMRKGRKPRSSR